MTTFKNIFRNSVLSIVLNLTIPVCVGSNDPILCTDDTPALPSLRMLALTQMCAGPDQLDQAATKTYHAEIQKRIIDSNLLEAPRLKRLLPLWQDGLFLGVISQDKDVTMRASFTASLLCPPLTQDPQSDLDEVKRRATSYKTLLEHSVFQGPWARTMRPALLQEIVETIGSPYQLTCAVTADRFTQALRSPYGMQAQLPTQKEVGFC